MEENIFKETSEVKNLACDFLMKGEIVAIKAETVYGLVCDASNQKSISKIYQINYQKLEKRFKKIEMTSRETCSEMNLFGCLTHITFDKSKSF